MAAWRVWLKGPGGRCALWVALCFMLTSAVYLGWVRRLMALSDGRAEEWLSLVAGYLFQAAGLLIVTRRLRGDGEADLGRLFSAALTVLIVASVPAMLGSSLAGVAAFGLIANLACGVIAGVYLRVTARRVGEDRLSLAFAGGYAAATVAVGLLALLADGALVRGPWALAVCVPLAAAVMLLKRRMGLADAGTSPEAAPRAAALSPRVLALACAAVALASLVKNLGFAFPSSDIAAGLTLELSRVPYAAGLLAAGLMNDRSRKNGVIFTVAALAVPFIMLGMAGEPVPEALLWGLGYLFYGFFSVFRAVLFMDLALRTRRWALAPLGLLAGRVGDAAGTAITLVAGRGAALVLTAAALFFLAVFLLFRLYQRLYEPKTVQRRSEQEVFEVFCLHHDLSARERDILRLMIDNRTNGEIAESLFISANTVKYHVRNVLQKTGCPNRGELQKKYKQALYPHLEEAPELTLT